MSISDFLNTGTQGTPDRQARDTDASREASTRLPARLGRLRGQRPAVDPDLEQFLTSSEFKIWPDQNLSTADSDDVYEPEVLVSKSNAPVFPTWKKLSDEHVFSGNRPVVETVHQVVHVPAPEPLFPDIFGTSTAPPSDPEKIIRVLFRRFPVFLFVAMLVWSAVGVYIAYVPSKFETSTTLLVDTQGFQDKIKELPRSGSENASLGNSKLANQTLILQSSTELASAASAELATVRAESPDAADWTIFETQAAQAANGATIASLLRNEYVKVESGAGDASEPDAITIRVTSTDPREAALIANVYGRTYASHVDDLISRHFEEALDYYRQRQDGLTAELDGITDELKSFIRTDGSLFGSEESRHVLDQISNLTASLDQTSIEISELRASISALDHEMTLMDGRLVAERAAHGFEDQLDKNYERIAELNIIIQQFYVKNPDLKVDPSPSKELVYRLSERSKLQTQVDELSQSYSNSITEVGGVDLRSYDGAISYMAKLRRSISENKVLLNAAIAKESATLIRLADYESRRKTMPEREVEYADIKNRQTFATSQVRDLDDKIRTIEEAADARRAFVRILTPANLPIAPKTSPKLILLLGGLIGLLAGIGAAMGSEKTDRRLYEETDIEKLGLDVICTVPNITNVSRKTKRVYYDRTVSSELVTLLNPESPATRSLRSIPLRFAGQRLNHSVFVFSGIEPGVGTTFLATNTAASLARSGAKVLLIDANIGNLSVANVMGLTEQSKFDLDAFSFAEGKGIEVFSSYLPNLYAMTIDTSNHGNAEILLSNNLVPLIQQIRPQFDAVIIDTSSLSTSTMALGLSKLSDELILVVRSGASSGKRLKEMAEDVRSTTGSSVKAVLNGFESARVSNKFSKKVTA